MDKTTKVLAKQAIKSIKAAKPQPPKPPPYSGTGTRARLNTAAEKAMFSTKLSK